VDFIADTTVLVGLWRRQEWALRFAQAHAGSVLGLPWVVLGEFWHGARRAGHDPDLVSRFLELGLPILDAGPVVPVYAGLCAVLQDQPAYREMGQNDLWIAAVGMQCRLPVLTRNRRHFGAVPDLECVALNDGS